MKCIKNLFKRFSKEYRRKQNILSVATSFWNECEELIKKEQDWYGTGI